MKKIKMLMILLFAVIPAIAQTGWDVKRENADPLKGIVERTKYRWQEGETMAFAFYDVESEWKVRVAKNSFKADPRGLTKSNNFIAYAKVGIYDNENNIIEAWEDFHMELTDMYRTATAMSDSKKQRKANQKIAEHLRTGHGYVRILMETHFGNGFDLKVPCLLDSK